MMWCEGEREKEKIGGGKDSDTYNIYISGTVCVTHECVES